MPIPVNDASQALKTSPEKTEEALQKVLPTVTYRLGWTGRRRETNIIKCLSFHGWMNKILEG